MKNYKIEISEDLLSTFVQLTCNLIFGWINALMLGGAINSQHLPQAVGILFKFNFIHVVSGGFNPKALEACKSFAEYTTPALGAQLLGEVTSEHITHAEL